jgi:hypothetical protein
LYPREGAVATFFLTVTDFGQGATSERMNRGRSEGVLREMLKTLKN